MWRIREAGPRAAATAPGAPLEWEGWDDAAVAPEKLGAYLRDLRKLLDESRYRTGFYGHFGHGCIHMRVNFDLETEGGIRKYADFVDRAADLVVRYGGSLSGEHGDGQARGALLPKMFGDELMAAFQEFKAIWDPDGKLNPRKLIDAYLPTENLRLGADYSPRRPITHFAYPDDGGSLERASLRCVGLGECRKHDTGSMCPSYMVTLEEQHSTRGRAHMLFELLQGEVVRDGWHDEDVKKTLDLCLSCKACKSECPTNVDIATYRAEFLAHYYDGRRRPIQAYAFGMIDRWLRIGAMAPTAANAIAGMPGVTTAIKRFLHVSPERRLPRLAEVTFRQWAAQQGIRTAWTRRRSTAHGRDPVGRYVQQLLSSRNQQGGARGPSVRRFFRDDSAKRALLRSSFVRLRPARSREEVSAHDPAGAPRGDRCGRTDGCARAQLRVRLPGRAPQSVSKRCASDATAQSDLPAIRASRIRSACPISRLDSRSAPCSTGTAIRKR